MLDCKTYLDYHSFLAVPEIKYSLLITFVDVYIQAILHGDFIHFCIIVKYDFVNRVKVRLHYL